MPDTATRRQPKGASGGAGGQFAPNPAPDTVNAVDGLSMQPPDANSDEVVANATRRLGDPSNKSIEALAFHYLRGCGATTLPDLEEALDAWLMHRLGAREYLASDERLDPDSDDYEALSDWIESHPDDDR